MRDGLKILADWTDAGIDTTAARIKIDVAGNNACRAENHWSRSIDDAPHLSAMPLALWLASSWWRLRWEGRPTHDADQTSWRMAHEVAAAGGGFLWPRLTFVSDGETIQAECVPTDTQSREMLRYISRFSALISASAFETGVDDFINLVLERTGAGSSSLLADLWAEVVEERANPETYTIRRLEAAIGFDPEQAPAGLIQALIELQAAAGQDAAAEIAAICAGPDPAGDIFKINAVASTAPSVNGHLARNLPVEIPHQATPAPDRGRILAHSVRAVTGVGADAPVGDDKLAELLGITDTEIAGGPALVSRKAPLAIAVTDEAGNDRIVFRGRHSTSRRFEAARLLCDGLTHKADRWYPATNADTARQKMQRAFAAEFLVPIESLREYLGGDYSMDAIEGASEYFSVSSYTIGSHLANNGLISRRHPAVPL